MLAHRLQNGNILAILHFAGHCAIAGNGELAVTKSWG
jgi:hypothetical protein